MYWVDGGQLVGQQVVERRNQFVIALHRTPPRESRSLSEFPAAVNSRTEAL